MNKEEIQKEFNDLQESYNKALLMICNLRKKRNYWEKKFKKLEEKSK